MFSELHHESVESQRDAQPTPTGQLWISPLLGLWGRPPSFTPSLHSIALSKMSDDPMVVSLQGLFLFDRSDDEGDLNAVLLSFEV